MSSLIKNNGTRFILLTTKALLIVSLALLMLTGSFLLCVSGVEASGFQELGDLEIGDEVVDPSWEWEYRTGDDYSSSGETKPVTWIVVAKDHYASGTVTLLADELIGKHAFDNSTDRGWSIGSNHWGNSGTTDATRGIRKFLNGSSYTGDDNNIYDPSFYDSMSAGFKNSIVTITVPNKEWEEGGSYTTEDKVFIPSTTELGDTGHSMTYPIGTVYAHFSGATDDDRIAQLEGTNTLYCTRSPYSNGGYGVRGVSGSGTFIFDYANGAYFGVRPALNLQSDVLVSETQNDDGVYVIMPLYNLSLFVNPVEGGTATDDTDESPYIAGTEVSIKAEPNEGYTFSHWSADHDVSFDDENAAETTFTMPDQNVTVTANFIETYTLDLASNPVEGGTATDDTDESSYIAGAEVSIKAEPNESYTFSHWSAPAGSFDNETSAETTFIMPNQDVTVTANFTEIPPSLAVSYPSGSWLYNPYIHQWDRFTHSTAHAIAYADMTGDSNLNLIASFPSGTWYIDANGSWVRITAATARALYGRGETLLTSFASGTWEYNISDGTWYRLTRSTAHAITSCYMEGDSDKPVFSFDSGTWYIRGLNAANSEEDSGVNTLSPGFAEASPADWQWVRLSNSTARALSGIENILYASFASGTWEYHGSSNTWFRITSTPAIAIANADMSDDGYYNPVFSFPSGSWFIGWSAGASSGKAANDQINAISTNSRWYWEKYSNSTARAMSSTLPWIYWP